VQVTRRSSRALLGGCTGSPGRWRQQLRHIGSARSWRWLGHPAGRSGRWRRDDWLTYRGATGENQEDEPVPSKEGVAHGNTSGCRSAEPSPSKEKVPAATLDP
jgi:hypothetical protein